MECSIAKGTDHPPRFLFYGGFFSPPAATCFAPFSVHCQSLIPIALISGMGQHPWATPEQLNFLKSFIHMLLLAKKTTGLATLYSQAYDGFLQKWAPEPIAPGSGASLPPEVLETKARERLYMVSILLNVLRRSYAHGLPAHPQLVPRGTKEGKAPNPPILCTNASCP